MFYVKSQATPTRETFLPLVSRLKLNNVRIEVGVERFFYSSTREFNSKNINYILAI